MATRNRKSESDRFNKLQTRAMRWFPTNFVVRESQIVYRDLWGELLAGSVEYFTALAELLRFARPRRGRRPSFKPLIGACHADMCARCPEGVRRWCEQEGFHARQDGGDVGVA